MGSTLTCPRRCGRLCVGLSGTDTRSTRRTDRRQGSGTWPSSSRRAWTRHTAVLGTSLWAQSLARTSPTKWGRSCTPQSALSTSFSTSTASLPSHLPSIPPSIICIIVIIIIIIHHHHHHRYRRSLSPSQLHNHPQPSTTIHNPPQSPTPQPDNPTAPQPSSFPDPAILRSYMFTAS